MGLSSTNGRKGVGPLICRGSHLASLAQIQTRTRVSSVSDRFFPTARRKMPAHWRIGQHSRRDLTDPAHSHLLISDICFRWGFIDAAHFSRAFHNAFGVSPRDFRRAAKAMADRILQHANRGWSKPQQRRRPRAGRPTKGPASGAGKLRFIPVESLLRPLGSRHWVPVSQIRKRDAVFKSHGIRDRAVRRQCTLQRKLRRPTQRQR
jgi:AraC-like DNA-binding protein